MSDRNGLFVAELTSSQAGDAAPVLLVHGFAQDHRCWGPLGAALGARGPVLAVDAPGHGRSGALASADVPQAADLLAQVAAATGRALDVVGYSMGGRMALQLLVDHPGAVRRAALIGATAGIADPSERAARRALDDERAAHLETVGIDAFLADWLAQPLFAELPQWARFDEERRNNTVNGLAQSLRNAGTGSMAPLWDRLPEITAEVLCVAGSNDPKFCDAAERMADLMPRGSVHMLAGAGHAAHLEQPDDAERIVREFLNRD